MISRTLVWLSAKAAYGVTPASAQDIDTHFAFDRVAATRSLDRDVLYRTFSHRRTNVGGAAVRYAVGGSAHAINRA